MATLTPELADKILQDIKDLPSVGTLATILQKAPKDDLLMNWLNTGKLERPLLLKGKYFIPTSFIIRPEYKDKLIISIIGKILTYASDDDLKILANQLLLRIGKRSDVLNIIKKAQLSAAINQFLKANNIQQNQEAVDFTYVAKFLLLGENPLPTMLIDSIAEFLYDPVHGEDLLDKLIDTETINDYIIDALIIANINFDTFDDQKETLKHLLDLAAKHLKTDGLQYIHDYFFPAPSAPDVPVGLL